MMAWWKCHPTKEWSSPPQVSKKLYKFLGSQRNQMACMYQRQMSFQCWNYMLKKNPPWFEKTSKKLSRVCWIKFNSEVALYFTRKINQMMQDIHISFIPLAVLPLGFLWSFSQDNSAWSTWRGPMPNIIPLQDRKEFLLPYLLTLLLETSADLCWPMTADQNWKRHLAKASEKFLAPKVELRRNRSAHSTVYKIPAWLSGV